MFSRRRRSLLSRADVCHIISPSTQRRPRVITHGYYDDTTDIDELHRYVVGTFAEKESTIPDLEAKIAMLRDSIRTQPMYIVDLNMAKDEIRELRDEIERVRSKRAYHEYVERSSPILEKWKELASRRGYFAFGTVQTFSPEKLALIRTYIQLASEYAPLDLTVRPSTDSKTCPYCREPFDEQDNNLYCESCNVYQSQFSHDAEFSDLSRINGSNNNNYVNRETFIKTLAAYQGKQRMDIPHSLTADFDKYCDLNKISVADMTYDRARPIFKSIGYSAYFDDINLFLSIHPDVDHGTPDISEHEDEIVTDYDRFTQKYAELKGDARNSALNAWYLLYILMVRRKIPCDRRDLKMPDTKSIRVSNDNIARTVFESLGWTFTDTV